jgi:hypothetical protein
MQNFIEKLGTASTGASVRACLSVWNAVSCLAVQTKRVSFFKRVVKVLAMTTKCLTNLM